MADDWTSNVEALTPEKAAERLILEYGDQAATQAALHADHHYSKNDLWTAKIWHEAMRLIEARGREMPGTIN